MIAQMWVHCVQENRSLLLEDGEEIDLELKAHFSVRLLTGQWRLKHASAKRNEKIHAGSVPGVAWRQRLQRQEAQTLLRPHHEAVMFYVYFRVSKVLNPRHSPERQRTGVGSVFFADLHRCSSKNKKVRWACRTAT